jgi:hypothetical protein
MDFVVGLGIILAVLAGSACGSLLTIRYYRRVGQDRMAYEDEAAQSRDVLAGLALLRRTRTDRRGRPSP